MYPPSKPLRDTSTPICVCRRQPYGPSTTRPSHHSPYAAAHRSGIRRNDGPACARITGRLGRNTQVVVHRQEASAAASLTARENRIDGGLDRTSPSECVQSLRHGLAIAYPDVSRFSPAASNRARYRCRDMLGPLVVRHVEASPRVFHRNGKPRPQRCLVNACDYATFPRDNLTFRCIDCALVKSPPTHPTRVNQFRRHRLQNAGNFTSHVIDRGVGYGINLYDDFRHSHATRDSSCQSNDGH